MLRKLGGESVNGTVFTRSNPAGSALGECAGLKSRRRPSSFKIRPAASNSTKSAFTALAVTKSAMPSCSARLETTSKRSVSTAASNKPRARIASRRKALFRSFDSIIVNRSALRAILSGIAGDPPPDPRSTQPPGVWVGICRAAANGSTSSRSKVSSVGASSGSAVRLILAFHCVRSRK